MNRVCSTFLLSIVSTSWCLAQPETQNQPPQPPGRERQLGRTMPPRGMMGNLHSFVEQMKTELSLDAAQQSTIQAIVDDHNKRMQETRSGLLPSPEESKQMSELKERLKKANEANDQNAIKEVSEEMQKVRKVQMDRMAPVRDQMTKSQDELKDKLRSVLRDDQRPKFDKLWDDNMNMAPRSRKNPRLLKSMIERLPDVTSEQKQQITDLLKKMDEATRAQKDMTPTQREDLSQKTYDGMLALLTPEQREKVQARLEGRPGTMPRGPEGASNPHPPTKP